MTKDEVRELILAALRADERISQAQLMDPPDQDAVGAYDVHGEAWWIVVDQL